MAIDEQEFGKLVGHLELLLPTISEIKCDVKSILSSQAVTEERLRNGNRNFEEIENTFRKHAATLSKKADWRVVYPLIIGAGCVLVFLIDHYYGK